MAKRVVDAVPAGVYNSAMQMYPLKFEPIYKHRIWGGQKLREVFGKDIPPDVRIGESWEVADLPEDKSVIANGPLAGRTLAWAVEAYREQITGDRDFSLPFPLLIKFLDAEEVLSVQVHPDAETCRRMGKGDPKTECWYIISAPPDGLLYKGLRKGVTAGQFADSLKAGTVAELLEAVPVKPGQCHFLPAGTLHAIGPGLLVAEIQTPSDTTYRVFDWNRLDEHGKPRPLHIDEALESIHFGVCGSELPVTTTGRLVESDYFAVDKIEADRDTQRALSPGQMRVLIIISGSGRIEGGRGEPVEFRAGRCLLIPADYEGVVAFSERTEYLVVTV